MPLLSATVLVCEDIQENDGVYSAIGISDLLECNSAPDLSVHRQTVEASVLATLRFSSDDNDDHTAILRTLRPDGSGSDVGDPVPIQLRTLYSVRPGTTKTWNMIADLEIVPRMEGVYCLVLLLDDDVVARFAFTLLRAGSAANEQPLQDSAALYSAPNTGRTALRERDVV